MSKMDEVVKRLNSVHNLLQKVETRIKNLYEADTSINIKELTDLTNLIKSVDSLIAALSQAKSNSNLSNLVENSLSGNDIVDDIVGVFNGISDSLESIEGKIGTPLTQQQLSKLQSVVNVDQIITNLDKDLNIYDALSQFQQIAEGALSTIISNIGNASKIIEILAAIESFGFNTIDLLLAGTPEEINRHVSGFKAFCTSLNSFVQAIKSIPDQQIDIDLDIFFPTQAISNIQGLITPPMFSIACGIFSILNIDFQVMAGQLDQVTQDISRTGSNSLKSDLLTAGHVLEIIAIGLNAAASIFISSGVTVSAAFQLSFGAGGNGGAAVAAEVAAAAEANIAEGNYFSANIAFGVSLCLVILYGFVAEGSKFVTMISKRMT